MKNNKIKKVVEHLKKDKAEARKGIKEDIQLEKKIKKGKKYA